MNHKMTTAVASAGPYADSSFVRFIRGGGWLLAVFRRAFSYRQRWGLDMAQCAIYDSLMTNLEIFRKLGATDDRAMKAMSDLGG